MHTFLNYNVHVCLSRNNRVFKTVYVFLWNLQNATYFICLTCWMRKFMTNQTFVIWLLINWSIIVLYAVPPIFQPLYGAFDCWEWIIGVTRNNSLSCFPYWLIPYPVFSWPYGFTLVYLGSFICQQFGVSFLWFRFHPFHFSRWRKSSSYAIVQKK